MYNFIINFLSKNVFRNIRNFFLIKPTFALKPIKSKTTISDFFYWKQDNDFSTKFMLTNLSSQTYPEQNEIDYIKILIFDNNGKKIKSINFELEPFQTIDVLFDRLDITGFGSFCVFHSFEKLNSINKENTFLAERGYVGYREFDGVWNFMHGNHYACYLNNYNVVKSILAKSIFKFSYLPQVSFLDCNKASLILNNPTNKKLKFIFKFFSSNNKFIKSKSVIISKFGTSELTIDNKTAYLYCVSNMILSRPVIIKKYATYFDIFHG